MPLCKRKQQPKRSRRQTPSLMRPLDVVADVASKLPNEVARTKPQFDVTSVLSSDRDRKAIRRGPTCRGITWIEGLGDKTHVAVDQLARILKGC